MRKLTPRRLSQQISLDMAKTICSAMQPGFAGVALQECVNLCAEGAGLCGGDGEALCGVLSWGDRR
jgi:hypothetical protein